jgi:7-cyano-7-deazaguanine synthase in queuosine biosynthesis
MDAEGFFKALLVLPSQRCLDLLRMAVGFYCLDRIVKRRSSAEDDYGVRRFEATVEVHDTRFWRKRQTRSLLQETLFFLTGDDWSISFIKPSENPRHQAFLDLPRPFQPRRAVLFSGGLDSAAGLASKVISGANDLLVVTVGHQSGLQWRIHRQLYGLRRLMADERGLDVRLLHSTLVTSLKGGKARRLRQQEQTQRSRSFLFCAAATIAAKAYDLKEIEILENGVGAINAPLMTGMLGDGMGTRGAHPTFLRLMSDLCTSVAASSIEFALPNELRTKAEVLADLRDVPGIAAWLRHSRSCIHTALRHQGKTHCGRCPGCIERRQAFACADIADDRDTYLMDIFSDEPAIGDADYLRLYQLDAVKWLRGEDLVRRRLDNHLRLTNLLNSDYQSIRELQLRHSREVQRAFGLSIPERLA